jgi:Tol biopolymer transport system component
LGTVAYMSPEQARGKELDVRTDLFSFGSVLYEMATGQLPFRGDSTATIFEAILNRTPVVPVRLNPDLPPKLEEIINKALEKNRELRYQHASDIRTDLQRLKRDTESKTAATVSSADRKWTSWHGMSALLERKVRWITTIGAVLVASAVLVWWRKPVTAPQVENVVQLTHDGQGMEVVPLAGLEGAQLEPAFSPDGNQIVFALQNGKNSGIYSVLVSGGRPLRLTTNSSDSYPKWSPNGREIAFTRSSEQRVAINVLPSLGGPARKLYDGFSSAFSDGFDWSPDGRFLAISQAEQDGFHARIALLSLSDSEIRPLTAPSEQDTDSEPAFSPDGSTVAFVRSNAGGMVNDLYVAPLTGGEAKRLTFDHRNILGSLAWTPDGKEILFSSSSSGFFRLWRISASGGGSPQPVVGGSVKAFNPTVSIKGNQLAYQQVEFQNDIWRLNLKGRTLREGAPVLVVGTKAVNMRPQFSPDGTKIAFESFQSGYFEIWVCDSDGSNCGSLTSLRGVAGAPRWSPDGRHVAFEYRPQAYSQVYIAEVGGGPPILVATFPGADSGGPSWSRDGQWIYFYSDREHGRFQIYKTRLSGGSPIQVTKNGGAFGTESADGRFFYFAKVEAPGIWRMPLIGGDEETRILDQPGGSVEWCNWILVDNGIYFLDSGERSIQFFDFASRKKTPIFKLDREPRLGLAISPDKRSILFVQDKLFESNIILVKNFR